MRQPPATTAERTSVQQQRTTSLTVATVAVAPAAAATPPPVSRSTLALAVRADGTADLTITLLLRRRPTALETEVSGLVVGGWLDLATTGRPREGLRLLDRGDPVTTAPPAGPGAAQRLLAYLTAPEVLAVVTALSGTPCGLTVGQEGGPDVDLADLVELATGARVADAVVMLAPTPGDRGLSPVPRRAAGSTARAMPDGPLRLRVGSGAAYSMAVAADPGSVRPTSAALAGSAVARQVMTTALSRRWLVDDAVLPVLSDGGDDPGDGEEQVLESLPLIEQADGAVFTDATDPSVQWYAPDFVLVPPAADADPATSSFLFEITAAGGVLGPGGLGAGLTGHLRLRLQPTVPEATTAALAGAVGTAVATDNVAVTVKIPYRQANTTDVQTQAFPATVTAQPDGTVLAELDLLDDFVRLAYASLSTPGFLPQPVQVAVTYTFRGYRQMRFGGYVPEAGGKISELPMLTAQQAVIDPVAPVPDPVELPALAADGRSVVTRDAVISFAVEPVEQADRALPARFTRVGDDAAPLVVTPRTPLQFSPDLRAVMARPRYLMQSVVHESDSTLSVPCAGFGGLYRQTDGTGTSAAIGCQDYLRLGVAPPQRYAELVELRPADGTYQVWRSLAQPGVFVIVPATYRVARCSPTQGPARAYRPAMLVYAVVDAMAAPRYTITATLEPDLLPAVRDRLGDQLAASTPAGITPTLMLPTDPAVGATASYQWLVDPSIGAPQTVTTWNGFTVEISTTLASSLLLVAMVQNAGLSGSARLVASDGTAWQTTLVLDTDPCGPWDVGPVSCTVDGTTATLTNHVERPVSVTQIGTHPAGGAWSFADAALDLAAGGTGTLPVPDGTAAAVAQTVVGGGRLTLEQISVFTEDVQAQVTFLNTVTFSNHGGITAFELSVRLPGATTASAAAIGSGASVTLPVTLPIVDFAVSRVLEYQVVATLADASSHTSAWKQWDLSTNGVVVSLVWGDLFPDLP